MIPAPLLVVTDRHGSGRPLKETVRAVLDGGARWIWFRDKDLEPQARGDLAAELLLLVREAGGRLTIGGDVGLAAEIGADGVHLGGSVFSSAAPTGLSDAVASTRRALKPGAFVGLSAHGFADVRAAAEAGADYVTLSPIFATASKPGYGPSLGFGALREAAAIDIPILALGGIGPHEAAACRAAGAAGVAVMGRLMRSADPAAAARAFLEALGPASESRA